MKTKKELDKLSRAIGLAVRKYHQAIYDNLKESNGKEFEVQGDDEEENGMRLRIDGRHDDLVSVVVDKVRFTPNKDGDGGNVEIHINEEEYDDTDYWLNADYIGCDVIDYIYDNIIWED